MRIATRYTRGLCRDRQNAESEAPSARPLRMASANAAVMVIVQSSTSNSYLTNIRFIIVRVNQTANTRPNGIHCAVHVEKCVKEDQLS